MIETLKTFTALSEEFVELLMKHDPVAATDAGIHDYDAALPDDSPDGLRARSAWLRDLDQRLVASVPWDELPLESRVDFALLRSRIATLRAELEEMRVPTREPARFLLRAFRGVQLLLGRPFAPLDERKESAVARLMAIPDYLEAAGANLDAVPAIQLEAGVELAVRGPAFVDDVVRRLLRSFPGEAERLEHAGGRARTGFLRFHDRLDRELRPRATDAFALSERWLNYRLERTHLLGWNSADVERLARERAAELAIELEDEARRIDPRRDWRELLEEGRRRCPEASWVRETYIAEIDRARQLVIDRRIASLPEGEKLEVAELPAYERGPLDPVGYQGPAPLDADSTGTFLFQPVDLRRDKDEQARQLRRHCAPLLPLFVARDGYPGRHLLRVHGNRASSRLRRITNDTVMADGWASYAEELMAEEGFLTPDPAGRLFQLASALRRAVAAEVSVGLHCGRLAPPAAAARLADAAGLEPDEAEAEVRACCVSAGRGVGALVGRQALRDLAAETRKRLGGAFDRARFHDAALGSGVLPPALVREELGERLGRP
ncbi:MAG TPA: DUF885 domain-containing protein [Candidatus Acidoferrales bacterium]|nr:DUF885 domain-containing protein [Candidatus Acidoferrales bacterium]